MSGWFVRVDWVAVGQAAVSVATLMVALSALNTWRDQKSTDRILALIEELVDGIHEFLQEITIPIQILDFIHIGIESKQIDPDLNAGYRHPQAIRFIESEGERYASKLMSELGLCRPIVHRVESLLVKAQIFSISEFVECDRACRLMMWQYQRLNAVYAILSSPNLNWEHPRVAENLDSILEITSDSIKEYLNDNQVVALNFLRDLYASQLNFPTRRSNK